MIWQSSHPFILPHELPMSDSPYRTAEWQPWISGCMVAATMLAVALLLTFMLGGVLQWRGDVRAQATAAATARYNFDRHDPEIARFIQVGSLR